MSTNQIMDVDGIQSVATTIEKVALEDGRELQWLIRNFDVVHSSPLNKISQNFGPLNGKVLIKLDLTKKDGSYELGVRVQPTNNVMWMSFQFKLYGTDLIEFSISGDPRDVRGNRLIYTLNIPSQKELKFTFKPEILLSVADIVVGTPMEETQSNHESTAPTSNSQQSNPPLFNTQWASALPTFLQQTLNQRINECNTWANFFTNYPNDLNSLQQHITSILSNSELIRESPRMVNSLINELRTNPDYATVNQRIQEFMTGTRQHCENFRTQMQQNTQESTETAPHPNFEVPITQESTETVPHPNVEVPITQESTETTPHPNFEVPITQESNESITQQPLPSFPPCIENVRHLFQQLPAEQRPIIETVQSVLESANNAYEQYRGEFAGFQQQYNDLITFPTTEQPTTEQLRVEQPTTEKPTTEQQPIPSAPTESSSQVMETNVEEVRAHSSTSSSRPNDTSLTYVFATKGITGYVRHVKSLNNRLPYHRNFCSAQDWVLPDGKTIKVELVHALHPDAPFVCLFDYDNSIDMCFVQTLLDGNGQEIHKIDSFSNSYQGFTPDMLLKSAEIDDCVRIRIEAIVDLD